MLYEVYADKFAGTFRAFAEKLGYLGDLGITCIHVLPFYPSSGVDGGYDVTDYTGVDERMGSLADAELFIAEASRRGIRVMIDLVLNHTSVAHPWFQEARRSPESPKRAYYVWSPTGKGFAGAHNPFHHLKPKNWIFDPMAQAYYFATFYPEQADLNWDNPLVEEEMFRVMDFWVGLGASAFRLDAAPYLVKREGTPCRHLPETHAALKRIRLHVNAMYPDIALLAEVHATTPIIASYFGTGDECHLAYHFSLMQQMYLALARNDLSIIERAVRASWPIPESCQWATFLNSHDEITLAALDASERAEVLAFIDPEDRWTFKPGESTCAQLATALRGDRARMEEAFRMLLGIPGSPVVYYGSEIGMTNTRFPGPVRDTRWYVRGAFDWAEAERQTHNTDSLWHFVSRLIRERSAGCSSR